MTLFSYIYSITDDFPNGQVNTTKLHQAIQNSEIEPSLSHIDTNGDELTINFRLPLSDSDKNKLDGGTGTPYNTHPAGGLIASTDTSATVAQPTLVSSVKPVSYARRYGFSPNFSDKTTWWEQAIKITNEDLGTGDSVQTVFNLNHGNNAVSGEAILDLEHGKVTEEDFLTPPGGNQGDYNILVKVAGIVKTQRECFEVSGGDYIVDYNEGVITFFTAPTGAVTCTYWYIPNNVGPTFTMLPTPGMQLVIDDAECSFSADVEMLDTMYSGAWLTDYNMWAPVPRNPTPYKNISDFYNYTYGAFPTVAAIGSNARGFAQNNFTLRWNFKNYIFINSNDTGNPAFRLATKHSRKPFSGLATTITIYALEIPLANKLI